MKFLLRNNPINGCEDGTHDVVSAGVQTTESLSAIMELGCATSALLVKLFYRDDSRLKERSFINQSYTWSRLLISEEHFRRLFTRLQVHPCFLDVVYLFQEKIRPVEEGLSSLFVDIVPRHADTEQTLKSQSCSYCTVFHPKANA